MKKTEQIIPAIITNTQKELDESLKRVEGFVDTVQLDVIDGMFADNLSMNFDFDLSGSDLNSEAHLMIKNPRPWIEKNGESVDTILLHLESCTHPDEVIQYVKKTGKKTGIAIVPETPVNAIVRYLDSIDQVLIMTVIPGYYGSTFLPDTVDKIQELRAIDADIDIEVDGGITPDTIRRVRDAGANMFVSGSFIMKSNDVKASIEALRAKLR